MFYNVLLFIHNLGTQNCNVLSVLPHKLLRFYVSTINEPMGNRPLSQRAVFAKIRRYDKKSLLGD
jgi:hypothetical protein